MPEKTTITLTCPYDETHIFQQTFNVEGLGFTEVQTFCPHCGRMGTHEISWNVVPQIEYRSMERFTIPYSIVKKR